MVASPLTVSSPSIPPTKTLDIQRESMAMTQTMNAPIQSFGGQESPDMSENYEGLHLHLDNRAGKASCDGTKPHQGIQDQANSTGAHLAQPRIPSPQLTPANVSNASVQPDCYPAPPPPPASNPTSPSHPFEYTHTPTTSNPAYDDTHTHYTHDIPDLNQGGRGDTGATFENDNLGRGYEGTRPRGGPVPLPHIEAEDGGVVDGEMNHRVEEQDRMDGGEGREGGESWPRAYSPMGGLPTGPGQAGKYGGANGLGVTV